MPSHEDLWWEQMIPKYQAEVETLTSDLARATYTPARKILLERKAIVLRELNNARRAGTAHAQAQQKLQAVKADAGTEDKWKKKNMTSAEARSPIGQNIDRLRKECGWSFEALARQTGMDKKQILSHVNKGTKPHPRIMREYAQAFTKELSRQITVADLEK
jgi:ribosome-binding protein aMBF1 (putative translation factor)